MIKKVRIVNFDKSGNLTYTSKLGLKKGIEDRGFVENKKAVQELLSRQPSQPVSAMVEWEVDGLPEGYRVGG